MTIRTPAKIAAGHTLGGLALDEATTPHDVLTLVDLTEPVDHEVALAAAARLSVSPTTIGIGVAKGVSIRPDRLTNALACTITDQPTTSRHAIQVPDVDAALERISGIVAAVPRACVTLTALLRNQAERLDTVAVLAAESLAYSMLLDGPEFRQWRQDRPLQTPLNEYDEPVKLSRNGSVLGITLNRPQRHNAFNRRLRDGLVEAFELVLADPSVEQVELRGHGPSFCSGGDLDEFGSAPPGSTAHLIRLDRSVGARIDRCGDRVAAHLHGACFGAGIELPAFAQQVVAAPDTSIRLPEIEMGLVPGAGGTVSITRRIGRWRTAYLALTAWPLSAGDALDWGLVDRVAAQ